MEDIQIIIRDKYCREDKRGSYIAHLRVKDELYKVVKKDISCCESRVQLIVKSIMDCVNKVENPSNFSIITLTNWGVTLIRNADGSWLEGNPKKLENSVHKDILLELQSLMKVKGHKISSYYASRNIVLDNISLDDDNVMDTYMSFKVKRDIKRKFEELCYNKGVSTERVLNRLLDSFVKRNV